MKMSKKYNDINVFKNSSIIYKRKISDITIYWIHVLLIGSFIFTFIAFFYEYELYDYYYGKITNIDEENYISLTVDENYISSKNRNYLTINEVDYKCKLSSFSDDYYLISNIKYWNVIYECELPEKLNVNNSIIQVKINKRSTTIFKELKRKAKEVIKNARTRN